MYCVCFLYICLSVSLFLDLLVNMYCVYFLSLCLFVCLSVSRSICTAYNSTSWISVYQSHGLKILREGPWGFCQILGGRINRGCENFGGRVHLSVYLSICISVYLSNIQSVCVYLWGRNDGEGVHDPVRIFFSNLRDQESSHAGAGASTERVS